MEELPTQTTVSALDLVAEAGAIALTIVEQRRMLQSVVEACVRHGVRYAAIYLSEGETPDALAGDPGLVEQGVVVALGGGLSQAGRLVITGDDQALGSALATLLTAALEHGGAAARRYRVADRLQQALLPASLAMHPTVRFDADYRAATAETEVGGDWYDAFALDDGRIAVSIGDIAGHGLEAAIAMNEARRAIRTAAGGFGSPSELLEYVNRMLCRDASIAMATAIVGYYDPRDRSYAYASAGHPQQIYVDASGRPYTLPGGGIPLGFPTELFAEDVTITLDAGTAVVLYTDGLLEYNRNIIEGEHLLAQTITRTPLLKSDAPAAALNSAIFFDVENTDDAATMVMLGTGTPTTPRAWRWSAHVSAVPIARTALKYYLIESGIDMPIVDNAISSFGEAIANAIEHGRARGIVNVEVELSPARICIIVRNQGPWVEYVPHDEGGRGMTIMGTLADGVAITTDSDSTTMRLTFRR